MRPKGDHRVRREAFVAAATQLFAERGYQGVSVRDVLDAVGEKSSSPSVLYYYFTSKDELYRCVVESVAQAYVAGAGEGFAESEADLGAHVRLLVNNTARALAQGGQLIARAGSVGNRLFVLDMREQVTERFAEHWEQLLVRAGLASAEEAGPLSLYLAGGIGQLLFSELSQGAPDAEQIEATMRRVAAFAVATLGISLEDLPTSVTEEGAC